MSKQLPVGLRYAAVYELDENGLPAASGLTAYEGLEFAGPKAFTINNPEPRRIVHTGNDRVLAVDTLPPTEPVTGELRVSADDLDTDAVLSGVLTFDVGEAEFVAASSDKQGSEPQVGLLLYQQALDTVTGLRRYRVVIIPMARVIPMMSNMDENPNDTRYMIYPTIVKKHLWGVSLSALTEGTEEAGMIRGMTENKPKLVAFLGDGTEDEFSFPADAPAAATAKIVVFKNGVEITGAAITKTTTKVTFTAAPALNDNITILYEV